MAVSFQTPNRPVFSPHLLAGAELYIYPANRSRRDPMIGRIEPGHPRRDGPRVGWAFHRRVRVEVTAANQLLVTVVRGETTKRVPGHQFSVRWPKNRCRPLQRV